MNEKNDQQFSPNSQPMITQYVRNKKREKIGIVIGLVIPGEHLRIGIGWSQCCKRDEFDEQRAYQIAIGRAYKGTGKNVIIPNRVQKLIDKISARSQFYFQQCQ